MRKKRRFLRSLVLPTLAVMVFASAIPSVGIDRVHAENDASLDMSDIKGLSSFRKDGYDQYIAQYEGKPRPTQEIIIEGKSYTKADGMVPELLNNFEGSSGTSIKTGEEGTIEWEINVPSEGLYNIGIKYFPVEGKSASIEREIRINGNLPFEGAATITLPRVWGNEKDYIEQDNRGNDLRPRQLEKPMWQEIVFKDMEGYYVEPYVFYFSQGKHTISLTSSREPLVIDYLKLYQENEVPSYTQVKAQYEQAGYKEAKDAFIKVQGEDAALKSAPTLYAISDRASPKTEPYHVSKIRINTIGGYNWRMPGQWIAWNIDVPEDGLYKIGIKFRQDELRGMYSTRKLWIDDKVPFEEMEKIPFYHKTSFQMKTLGEETGEPYLFYLTKGQHELKLEVTLGDVAPLLRQVESSLLELNYMYRKILMVTGSSPDKFRDYRLEKQIPNLLETFKRQSEIITNVSNTLREITGEKSDQAAILDTLAYQLLDLAERPETIPRRLETYKINVGGLGTWILEVREQPLEVDYLTVSSPEHALPKADAGFFRKIGHELTAFFYSFIEDYNSIGNVSEGGKNVTVWIGTGRDQAQVLKAMIDDTFTPKTGISINLKLVQMGVLLPATLAKQGPDVAMQIGNDIPVNYAMRNAVQDLSKFKDYDEVATRFRDSAIVPYRYLNGVYALPEQQVFSMLFYRKDILEQLGLEVPQTWSDVHEMIPVLQKHNMEFALPLAQPDENVILAPNQTFTMLLYQDDGTFYLDGGKQSDLGSEISMKVFKKWSEFYTNYKFPLAFDFPNRFRTGEMPIGIGDYTFYNHLSVSAPEIRGLWEFTPVPGTITDNGEIRRDVGSGGSAVVMMRDAQDPEAAWEFMKWWTEKDTQVRFGREMEGLMGAAARYPTANIEALKELPWPMKDYKNLEKQWEWVKAVPEVPGGYFTGRHLDNAFREVVNNGTNSREALFDYVRFINEEITIKRKEFRLD